MVCEGIYGRDPQESSVILYDKIEVKSIVPLGDPDFHHLKECLWIDSIVSIYQGLDTFIQ
jgi:hypothetical protein